jgi:hypothetical protein
MRNSLVKTHGIRTSAVAAALSLLTLTGCDQIDPLKRPYMWEATGVNVQNITATAANPADMTRGRETTRRRASMDTDSVDRLWNGKTAPLQGGSAGGGGGGGAAPATGGGT